MKVSLDISRVQFELNGATDIIIRRDFSHPPANVWRVLTEPALIQQWLGRMKICEFDPRPGGTFRFEWEEFSFFGTILAVEAPYHMTHVEHFSADPSYAVTITTDLAARAAGTRVTLAMRYANHEARANAITNGFTDGLNDVYGRLDSLLTMGF